MHKVFYMLLAVLCLFGLLFIRFRESVLFYDPLIDYFHGDYQNTPLPTFAKGKLMMNILFRYLLNMLLSLGLLWAVFRDRGIIKFTVVFYAVVFIVLSIVYYILLHHHTPSEYMGLFYVRRFLIQPLLVFLLLPAFFYYRKVNK